LFNSINYEVFSSKDARDLEKNKYDLIICDPPYGFNTSENEDGLSKLYSEFIDSAIYSLRPKGQLILCLPAESYTGRDLHYCTRSDIVSRQIILKAHQQNRIVYRPAQSIPMISLLPPYYWESERALRRTILHFCFL
jgi:tRNA G10  N-methylase Trm11